MQDSNSIDDQLKQLAHGREMDFQMDKVWSEIDQRRDKRYLWLYLLLFGMSLLMGGYIIHGQRTTSAAFDSSPPSGEQVSSRSIHERAQRGRLHSTSVDEQIRSSSSMVEPDLLSSMNLADGALPSSGIESDEVISETTGGTEGDFAPEDDASSSHDEMSTGEVGDGASSFTTTTILPAHEVTEDAISVSSLDALTELRSASMVGATHELPADNAADNPHGQVHRLDASATQAFSLVSPVDQRPMSLMKWAPKLMHVSTPKNDWSKCTVRQRWSMGGEVYGGYTRPIERYSAKSDAGMTEVDAEAYRSRWESVETMHGGYTAGLSVFVKSPKGVELMLGADYTRLTDELSLSQSVTTTTTIYDPMAYFTIDDQGNRIYMGDTVMRTVITNSTRTSAKHRSMFSIPLRIGYIHHSGDWVLGGHVGGLVQVTNRYDGVVLRPDETIIDLDKDNMDLFFDDGVRFSGMASLHIGRFLSDEIELFFRPEFRFYPQSWDSANHPLELDMHFGSALVGLRYHW